VKDLTIFGTPRSQSKRMSRSRRQRSRAFDENLNLANTEHDVVSQKSHKSGKSGKSARSAKSTRSHKLKRTKSKEKRKIKKRTASFDSEEIYERLYNPPKAKKQKEGKKVSQEKVFTGKRLKEQRKRQNELLKQYR
jgi:hypothetical protein